MKDFDYQLQTNHAFIYKLSTGQVVLFPAFPSADRPKCLVFRDQMCFDDCITRDYFPIDNYDRQLLDHEVELLKRINTNIQYFQTYLNERYGFTYSGLNRQIAQSYYSKVSQDKSGYPMSVIALGAVMGEILRTELNGKWVLKKNYGPYNPYYTPLILTGDNVFDVYDRLYSLIGSKITDSSQFFDRRFFGATGLKVYENTGIKLIEL